VGRGVKDVARRELERFVGEDVDPVVLVGQYGTVPFRELLLANDGDRFAIHLGFGSLGRVRRELGHAIDDRLSHAVGVGVVVTNRVGLPLMFPAVEDGFDRPADGFPVVVGSVDCVEEDLAVLGVVSSSGG
jgi:hypothetical protein